MAELSHLGAVCLPAHTACVLTRVQISVADPSTPVQAGQGPGPLHGAVMGSCNPERGRGEGDKCRELVFEGYVFCSGCRHLRSARHRYISSPIHTSPRGILTRC